jgi:hypothetical protein
MTKQLKLTYFGAPGRAEASRLMLSIRKTPFADIRITREQWPDLKDTTKFGQLPILELEDGRQLAQVCFLLVFPSGFKCTIVSHVVDVWSSPWWLVVGARGSNAGTKIHAQTPNETKRSKNVMKFVVDMHETEGAHAEEKLCDLEGKWVKTWSKSGFKGTWGLDMLGKVAQPTQCGFPS